MTRLIRLQFRLALSAILVAVLGGILIGRQANRPPHSAIASAPSKPYPKPVELIKKYALAEFAALIGIPLALAGLMLTAIATRDTARQLQLIKAQSQPTFNLTLHRVESSDVYAGQDELTVALVGNAESIVTDLDSALILRGPPGKPPWMIFPHLYWVHSSPREGLVARFEALNSSITSHLRDQKLEVRLVSTVTIHYLDLFGDPHKKYYQFSENVASHFYSVHYPREVTAEQGADCAQLIKASFTKLTKARAASEADAFVGSGWPTIEKYAIEVSEDQALRCLGPPVGKLR